MTADDRLDQLEPLLSEALTVLDGHTKQLRQLTTIAEQLVTAASQQSENISFLLNEQMALKSQVGEVRGELYGMKMQFSVVRNHLAELTAQQQNTDEHLAGVKAELTGLKTDVAGMDGKLDLLVQLLQKPS